VETQVFATGAQAAPNRFPTLFGKEKRSSMQTAKISKGLLLGVILLLAASAFAANKASFRVNDPLSVAGKQLQAGNYTATWDGSGPDIQLNILQGKKVVATTPARLVNVDRTPEHDTTVVKMDNGNRSLSEIRFSGKKYVVAIGDDSGGSAGASSGVR
jgi:hypothetical protein